MGAELCFVLAITFPRCMPSLDEESKYACHIAYNSPGGSDVHKQAGIVVNNYANVGGVNGPSLGSSRFDR